MSELIHICVHQQHALNGFSSNNKNNNNNNAYTIRHVLIKQGLYLMASLLTTDTATLHS